MRTREKIIEKIKKIEDESVLKDLMELIDFELDSVGANVLLNEEQKLAIDEGFKDINEGRSFSNIEVRKSLMNG